MCVYVCVYVWMTLCEYSIWATAAAERVRCTKDGVRTDNAAGIALRAATGSGAANVSIRCKSGAIWCSATTCVRCIADADTFILGIRRRHDHGIRISADAGIRRVAPRYGIGDGLRKHDDGDTIWKHAKHVECIRREADHGLRISHAASTRLRLARGYGVTIWHGRAGRRRRWRLRIEQPSVRAADNNNIFRVRWRRRSLRSVGRDGRGNQASAVSGDPGE